MSSSEGPTGKSTKRARARRPAPTGEPARARPRAGQAGRTERADAQASTTRETGTTEAADLAKPSKAKQVSAGDESAATRSTPSSSEPADVSAVSPSTPSAHARRVRVSRQGSVPPAAPYGGSRDHASGESSPDIGDARTDAAHEAHGAQRARDARDARDANDTRVDRVQDAEVVTSRVNVRAPRPAPQQLPLHADDDAPRPLARVAKAAHELAELSAAVSASAHDSIDLSDDFGLDAGYEARLRPWFESLCKHYVKVEVRGAERIPADGRALLVANHTRAPLWDGVILRTALRLHHATQRCPRWLVDDRQYHAPFLGTFVNRLGAVRACQENAERLLQSEELVAVFPEGANGANRRYEDRHRLQRFGRGGFVKLALRTGTPVIPIAIVTCDHTLPGWHSRLNSASRALRAPFSALTAGRSPLGLLTVPPITSPVRITIGEPIAEIARQDARATIDDALIHELNECVRGAVQDLVNATLRS